MLHDLLGPVAFMDDAHNGTWPARNFASFLEAANEAMNSRLYGGIHYRFGNERGFEMGQCVVFESGYFLTPGDATWSDIYLRAWTLA